MSTDSSPAAVAIPQQKIAFTDVERPVGNGMLCYRARTTPFFPATGSFLHVYRLFGTTSLIKRIVFRLFVKVTYDFKPNNVSRYVLTNPEYQTHVLYSGLRELGRPFLKTLLEGLALGRPRYRTHHFDRIMQDLFEHYKDDETTASYIEDHLAEIESNITPSEDDASSIIAWERDRTYDMLRKDLRVIKNRLELLLANAERERSQG